MKNIRVKYDREVTFHHIKVTNLVMCPRKIYKKFFKCQIKFLHLLGKIDN